jgi:hypothetical protein
MREQSRAKKDDKQTGSKRCRKASSLKRSERKRKESEGTAKKVRKREREREREGERERKCPVSLVFWDAMFSAALSTIS